MTVKATAPAKINLTLHITGKRDDGYHLLDSLVAFAEVGDDLVFAPAKKTTLTVDGPFAEKVPTGPENLVLKAARLLGEQTAAITLIKNLPVVAGIGGGSSDAAATLRGLAEMWNLPLPDVAAIVALGADVPVCMAPRLQRMEGIGEVTTRLKGWPKLPAVLVNAGQPVPTGAVFKALKSPENAPMPVHLPAPSTVTGAIGWLKSQRNDLQSPACMAVGEIKKVLTALEAQTAAGLVRMSGSGGTCFALFESQGAARVAAEAIQRDHPSWWVAATRLS